MQLVEFMFDFSIQGQSNSVLRPLSSTSSTGQRLPFPSQSRFPWVSLATLLALSLLFLPPM
jgi:hypothetical protein